MVDTEKAAIDVEGWHEGEVVELLLAPGDEIKVGSVIARLAGEGAESGGSPQRDPSRAATTAAPPAFASQSTTGAAPAPVATPSVPPRASPAARAAARARGIDLAKIHGTGPAGAITLEDVERAGAEAARLPGTAEPAGRAGGMRHAIATAMARSKREIPDYYLWDEVDVTAALAWIRTANAARPVTQRLLPAALLLAAVARAAHEFADMNGMFEHGAFRPAPAVHLGVAIALRSGGLRSSEIAGQTLTVTNLGDEGSAGLLGGIHPPQVAIVGIGRIAPRAVVEQGTIVIRDVATLSLAADHRVSDGRRGAQFLAGIAALLQQPELL